jgi:hypothetical protein
MMTTLHAEQLSAGALRLRPTPSRPRKGHMTDIDTDPSPLSDVI